MISHARLLEVLDYNKRTGVFTWRAKVSSKTVVGRVAGTRAKDKIVISVSGQRYAAHRLAWFYVNKVWPLNLIDHKNGDPYDNRFSNLRPADKSGNGCNRGPPRNNSTGLKGVCRHRCGKFAAQIHIKGKDMYLGLFTTPELAHDAYSRAAGKLHGKFVRTV